MSDTWYSRNEKTVKWLILHGSWAVGIACIATGISAPAGIAIIAAGSGYASEKPARKLYRRLRRKDEEIYLRIETPGFGNFSVFIHEKQIKATWDADCLGPGFIEGIKVTPEKRRVIERWLENNTKKTSAPNGSPDSLDVVRGFVNDNERYWFHHVLLDHINKSGTKICLAYDYIQPVSYID